MPHDKVILATLAWIEEAAGSYRASDECPFGIAAYYDESSEKGPWIIADDYGSECFETPEEAREAAAQWAEQVDRKTA